MDAYEPFEARILAWANARADLLAGVVVGSRARLDGTADQWSDLDLILFTNSPQSYMEDSVWLDEFGDLWAARLYHTGSGYPEWFALYAGGLKVDIVFVPVQPGDRHGLPQMLADFTFQNVFQRGLRVLFDKTGIAGDEPYLPSVKKVPALPTQDEFQNAEAHFWIVAAKAARLVQRNDLWRAKQACDSELKACLLTMLEWHAMAVYGTERDIWYEGRCLADLAEDRAGSALPGTFAAYDQADLKRALLATAALYHRLADEVAAIQNYDRLLNEEQIAAWISEL